MNLDEKWMRRALALAARGRGHVHPNPMVGAVLVRGGKRLAEGYHHAFGKEHAEIDTILKAMKRNKDGAKKSTLYVTLEPCAHWGKTPPCADAVVQAGITRVVAAMRDPNPLVSGKGFAILKRHGVSVKVGVLEDESKTLNRAFVMRMKTGRPYVTLKIASSLDGRTATVTGESKWITSAESRKNGHRLRAQVDAIAVGAETVRKDNPTLTSHGLGRNPVRIVFAGRRPLPRTAHVFNSSAPTWVIKNTHGPRNLLKTLESLARRGIAHLLVEGGPTLQQSFLEAGLVDEVIWYIAPMILGHHKHIKSAWRLDGAKDVCLRGALVS